MKFPVWVLLTCFFLTGLSPVFGKGAIDLVALKKQEEERRKKVSKSKQSITDANVNKFSGGSRPYGFVQMESESPPPAAEENVPAVPGSAAPADEKKQPDYWKRQQVQLETRIAELKESIQSQQLELNKLWSDFYIKNIPADQDAIKVQIAQVTNQLEQKKLFLSQSETQLEEFFENARKAGVPPGWLR
ncbi:MAG: hypothetical protein NTZ12_05825 [Candidatus Aminicenantes bacterium]|nr:hypothetical protein [Candidatus Aminicenantes bacterium]